MGTISADLCSRCVRAGTPCPKCLREIQSEDRQRGQENRLGWRGLIGSSFAKNDEPLSTAGEKAKRKREKRERKASQPTLATLPVCKCRDCRAERRITHYWHQGLSLKEAAEVAASEDDYSEDSMP